jgi:hypothetical protein
MSTRGMTPPPATASQIYRTKFETRDDPVLAFVLLIGAACQKAFRA